ncbi:MAG: cation diffusion facilitator family transporter [Planctomycetaceae bacterium]|nr:cation diffusion facilitator family transporter [Planctomycetaceae bacterium]
MSQEHRHHKDHKRGHGRHHGHHHAHLRALDFNKALIWGMALNAGFIVVEAAFGFWAESLALLADAGHNLIDVASLAVALVAGRLTKRKPTHARTYGWRKASILGALVNSVILLVAMGGITLEAVQRLIRPGQAAGLTIVWVAMAGFVINGVTALLFVRGRKEDLNIGGAFWHMAADAGVSLGVAAAGAAIHFTGWVRLDPAVTLLIVAVILAATWDLLKNSFNLAMDAVPANIDTAAIREYLESLEGVTQVHDMHIWAMSTTQIALTAHLIKPDACNEDDLLQDICRTLHHEFNVEHVTIQIERRAFSD